MSRTSTGSRNSAEKYRPLNAFMAFRSFYNRMLPNMQQKERSGVLTALWNVDPYKNQWAIIAKVFSYLRGELGKDTVSLSSFLEHACAVLGIPPLDNYLEEQGFALLEDQMGKLSLVKYDEAMAPVTVSSIPELAFEGGSGEKAKRNRVKTVGALTQNTSFQAFKEVNKENIAAAAKGFAEKEEEVGGRQGSSSGSGSGSTYGNEEAAAGLYAEHELLAAVFEHGLVLDETMAVDKKRLVQKLYSRAYEMLIGGQFPVVTGVDGFSRTIRNNPMAAAAQLFSRSAGFQFDVLVVDRHDRLKQHVLCAVDQDGQDQTFVLSGPETAHLTAQARAVAGPLIVAPKTKNGSGSGIRKTPTYTQQMAYQTSLDAGQFHVFSSQPSMQSSSRNDEAAAAPTDSIITMESDGMAWLHEMDMAQARQAALQPQSHSEAGESSGNVSEATTVLAAAGEVDAWMHGHQAEADADAEVRDYLEHDSSVGLSAPDGLHFVDLLHEQGSASSLGKHGRDGEQQIEQVENTAGDESPSKRCRLYDDLHYLMGAMQQDEVSLREQLARGQRPAVFADIYRSQAAAAMEGSGQTAQRGLAGYDFDVEGEDVLADIFGDSSVTADTDMQFMQWPSN
uniref:Alpha box protein n=1 Tax=Leptographium clavigerum TaxID=226899 RepID=M4PLX1_9PEZI|nr:alpha box protein [Leptographium clavigerum]AGH03171.1 alpha box protein [Leptographium clavigerum]AGH03175.1 alpha box protein [Leptographium clavigerum]